MKEPLPIEKLKFRGANLEAIKSKSHELILCSPADTGKTMALIYKLIVICNQVPGCHAAMLRATYSSLQDSAVKTFDRIAPGLGIKKMGGTRADKYIFKNRSEIVLIGLDRPEKLLSSEWDIIYVCQSEELKQAQWEIAASRVTGRGAVYKHPQIFGCCNPSSSKHWIKTRKSIDLISGSQKDNPELFDDSGQITEVGKKRMDLADKTLTGVRRKRLLEGLWATSEGAVYSNFDSTPGKHVVTRRWQEMVRWFLAIDVGFTNPTVILLIGEDGDGRQHLFKMFYQTGVVVEAWAKIARDWGMNPLGAIGVQSDQKPVVELVACDEAAAEPIQVLKNLGLPAEGHKGRVETGIERIRNRLVFLGDGLPRLTMDPSCTDAINEFESYIYKEGTDVPKKEFDHCSDCWRYLLEALGEQTAFDEHNIKGVSTGGLAQAAGLEQPRVFVPRTFTPTRQR